MNRFLVILILLFPIQSQAQLTNIINKIPQRYIDLAIDYAVKYIGKTIEDKIKLDVLNFVEKSSNAPVPIDTEMAQIVTSKLPSAIGLLVQGINNYQTSAKLSYISTMTQMSLATNVVGAFVQVAIISHKINQSKEEILAKIQNSQDIMLRYFEEINKHNNVRFDRIEQEIKKLGQEQKNQQIANIKSRFRCLDDAILTNDLDTRNHRLVNCFQGITDTLEILKHFKLNNMMIYAYYQLYYISYLQNEENLEQKYLEELLKQNTLEEEINAIDQQICIKYDCNQKQDIETILKNKLKDYKKEKEEMDLLLSDVISLKQQAIYLFQKNQLSNILKQKQKEVIKYENISLNDYTEKNKDELIKNAKQWIESHLINLEHSMIFDINVQKYQSYAKELNIFCHSDNKNRFNKNEANLEISQYVIPKSDGFFKIHDTNHLKIEYKLKEEESSFKSKCTITLKRDEKDSESITFLLDIEAIQKLKKFRYTEGNIILDISIHILGE